jgi:hypothetical protein
VIIPGWKSPNKKAPFGAFYFTAFLGAGFFGAAGFLGAAGFFGAVGFLGLAATGAASTTGAGSTTTGAASTTGAGAVTSTLYGASVFGSTGLPKINSLIAFNIVVLLNG